ncbi:MAG: hypothetical protein KR126chlam6_01040 [Candidatus Anoxychlamydiales bacterium]|nr:hypothetical protein [Candidatus Anoxychlamydiales bacterium]
MTTSSSSATSVKRFDSFNLAVKLTDAHEIKNLGLDGIQLISKGDIVQETLSKHSLDKSSVMILKRDLEEKIFQSDDAFETHKKLEIQSTDADLKLHITEKKIIKEPIVTEEPIESSKMEPSKTVQSKNEPATSNYPILGTIVSYLSSIASYVPSLFSKNDALKSTTEDTEDKPKTRTVVKLVDRKVFNESIKDIDEVSAKKIIDIKEVYSDACNLNNVFNKVANHNVKQLKIKPETNSKITKLLLISLVAGALAGTIGLGAILPHFGIISSSLGIVGLPLPATITCLALGAISVVSYVSLRIAAKKNETAKKYLEDIHLTKSNWFLESNINDTTSSILLILMTLTFIHSPWLTTLKGCLAYPTGILLIASGAYQLGESLKALANAKSIGDKKEILKSALNTLSSLAVIAMGIFTTVGMINSPINIATTCIFGALVVSVAGMNLKSSINKLKEIKDIKADDAEKIYEFLDKNLSLSMDDLTKLKDQVNNMSLTDIVKWIEKNSKNWDEKQKKAYTELLKKLSSEEIKENEAQIEEVKKMIFNEEMKNAIETKIQSLGSLITKETLQQTLEIMQEYKIGKTNEKDIKELQDKMIDLFKTIKSQTTTKSIAEIVKFFVLYIPFMIVPFLPSIIPSFNLKIYDVLMAMLQTANIAVNITPRFRNIPPTDRKENLDINNDAVINRDYFEMKAMLNQTDVKTGIVAEKAIA